MKAKDIKAGMACTVAWFTPGSYASGAGGYRRDYLASGKIVCRRGGQIKFQWESGDDMNCDFPGWPLHSSEFFRVSILDIKSIDGLTLREFAAMEPAQFKARAALNLARQ